MSIRTYESDYEPEGQVTTIIDAIRATSAALTYFKPLTIANEQNPQSSTWIDAGIKFNNPGPRVYNKVGKIWGNKHGVIDINDIAFFLSIGTGLPPVPKLPPKNLLRKAAAQLQKPVEVIELLQQIATDTEAAHLELDARFQEHSSDAVGKKIYRRLNVV